MKTPSGFANPLGSIVAAAHSLLDAIDEMRAQRVYRNPTENLSKERMVWNAAERLYEVMGLNKHLDATGIANLRTCFGRLLQRWELLIGDQFVVRKYDGIHPVYGKLTGGAFSLATDVEENIALMRMALETIEPGNPIEQPAKVTLPRARKGGRPSDTNHEEDKRIHDAWKSGLHGSLDDVARTFGKGKRDVELALGRHRKRIGKTSSEKPRQEE